jgi:butyrate kinase
MSDKNILIINPGSTSTKIAVYQAGEMQVSESVRHSAEELKPFKTIWDQYDFRKNAILKVLDDSGLELSDFDAIVCRGGNVKPLPGGIYAICPEMIKDMRSGIYGRHPTNVGGVVGYDLGRELGIPVFTMDPPMTDELCDEARLSGIPEIPRLSSFHALNQKATARKVATEMMDSSYDQVNMIVVHMGGGISVGAHRKGKVIDVNNALDGDGPFSPERAGTVPAGDLVSLCFSGEHSENEIRKMLTGGGGLVAYLGTTSGIDITQRISEGDVKAKAVFDTMAYQTAKEIGACAAVLNGEVDAIAITGSLAYSDYLIDKMREKIAFIAPIYLNPGENEMEALFEGTMRYYNDEEELSIYRGDAA